VLDISKILGLGWLPRTPLEIGVRETIKWYESNVRFIG